MEAGALRYVFGPVMSGRLGRSLGLDLLGERVCSMNCVYCESGPLAHLTLTRAPYVPAAAILAELAGWEAGRKERGEPLPDVVSLGGLGEPTLNSEMPEVIAGVRRILPGVPVAALTNASLMTIPAVRAELALADIVLPSLDALEPEAFCCVNRAHSRLDARAIADGILAFRREFCGKLYLEVLLVAGVNDSEQNLQLLADFCRDLRADRVDVVTLSRPGTELDALPVGADMLAHWRERLGVRTGELAAQSADGLAPGPEKGHIQPGGMPPGEIRSRILASLSRRPQTAAQLAAALLTPQDQVERILAELLAEGSAQRAPQAGETGFPYFQARG